MKNNINLLITAGFIAGALFIGCQKTSEQGAATGKAIASDATQDVKDIKADYKADWKKFKADSDEQIKANENRIAAFKEQIKKAGTKTEAKYKKGIAELEQKNRDLKQKLEDYKDDGETKWEVFKTDFSHDMDSIGKTMADLFKDNG
jgi:hypothetical protein